MLARPSPGQRGQDYGMGGAREQPRSRSAASRMPFRRGEDQKVGVSADGDLLGVKGGRLETTRVILHHVLDVEDRIGLLLRDRGEDLCLGDVLAQAGVDPRERIGFPTRCLGKGPTAGGIEGHHPVYP